MHLLRLTRVRDQKNVYICPARITSIEEDDGNTLIVAEGKNHWVIESPEDIIYNMSYVEAGSVWGCNGGNRKF